MASNYVFKTDECTDPAELLHQMWSGISEILLQKSHRMEFLNELVFNATTEDDLKKIKNEILKIYNFDFIHDPEQRHCWEHLKAHGKVLELQNQLLNLHRDAALNAMRKFDGARVRKNCRFSKLFSRKFYFFKFSLNFGAFLSFLAFSKIFMYFPLFCIFWGFSV